MPTEAQVALGLEHASPGGCLKQVLSKALASSQWPTSSSGSCRVCCPRAASAPNGALLILHVGPVGEIFIALFWVLTNGKGEGGRLARGKKGIWGIRENRVSHKISPPSWIAPLEKPPFLHPRRVHEKNALCSHDGSNGVK